ncbi:MAG: leucyl aminopeptidase family protein [Pseudomonadota bacterium]|nr:leucyl aminopeptidase family protein [Pseudomonadota bacterium]
MLDSTPFFPVLDETRLRTWVSERGDPVARWVESLGFEASPWKLLPVPGDQGGLDAILLGASAEEGFWIAGILPQRLPPGEYRIAEDPGEGFADQATLSWALGAYRFTRYAGNGKVPATLVAGPEVAFDRVRSQADGINLCRDLINTPAADMMPGDISDTLRDLSKPFGARFEELVGDELLSGNYPMVHAVGRASVNAPRMLEMNWGDRGPGVTLVGKGVSFDSGGLDIKPANGMRLMKKDMGGAAHVLGLAHMIMACGLPVRLRVLIPTAENAISGNAYRPGDVLTARNGKTVEIDNTDAEGRLLLADALCDSGVGNPQVVIDFATLTGAARVALGTEMPAMFSTSDTAAATLRDLSVAAADPVWPMPLHGQYRHYLKSQIADLKNCSAEPWGGAITAALFLREFVPADTDWLHFDVMGWNLRDRPGRPPGGEAMGLRAVFSYMQERFGRV